MQRVNIMRYKVSSLDTMDVSRHQVKRYTYKDISFKFIDRYEEQKRRRRNARSRIAMDCGIKKWFEKGNLYFLTLTSSPGRGYEWLCRDFEVLRKRVKNLVKQKIEYVAVKTREGFGVLHVIFNGKRLEIDWLKRQWANIHGADQVYIRKVVYSGGRLRNYLVKYLKNQGRVSYSWDWFKKGFMSQIRGALVEYRKTKFSFKFLMMPKFCVYAFNHWFYTVKSPEIVNNYVTQVLNISSIIGGLVK